jgi:phage/plasmid-associated DNA primase/5S rRNA maturation endonuclease (ribonuclease M5)
MKRENVDFNGAREILARRANIPFPQLVPKTDEEKSVDQARPDAQRLLWMAADYYHDCLLKLPDAQAHRDYLAGRGLTLETWRMMCLGAAGHNDGLVSWLRQKGADIDLALAIGVIHEKDGRLHDHFRDGIVIPTFEGGQVAWLSRRTIVDAKPKYLHLQNSAYFKKTPMDWRGSGHNRIVFEGALDLAAWKQVAGDEKDVPIGMALLGVNGGEFLEKGCKGAELVYIATDTDRAGQKAIDSLAKTVGYHRARLIVWPGDCKDCADAMKSGATLETFRGLLDNARKWTDYKLEELKSRGDAAVAVEQALEIALEMDPFHSDVWVKQIKRTFKDIKGATIDRQLAEMLGASTGSASQVARMPTDSAKPQKIERTKRADKGDGAAAFAEMFGDDFISDPKRGRNYYWVGTHWEAFTIARAGAQINRMVATVCDQLGISKSPKTYQDILLMAMDFVEGAFDRVPGRVNFLNGTYWSSDGELHPHDKSDRLDYVLDYEYEDSDGMDPKLWTNFFLNSNMGDPAAQEAYLAHIGLALMGDTTQRKSILLVGGVQSGKSTALWFANLLVGQPKKTSGSSVLFSPDGDGPKNRAQRANLRMVVFDELPANAFGGAGEELFKSMSAHSGVSQRELYQSELLDNQWVAKMMFSSNSQPTFQDTSGALASRLLTIRMDNCLKDTSVDAELLNKMSLERGLIAPRCLAAAERVLKSRTYPQSEKMAELRDEIEVGGNSVKAWVDAQLQITENPNDRVSSKQAYELYSLYAANERHDRYPVSMRTFIATLRDRYGIKKAKTLDGKQNALVGVKLSNPLPPNGNSAGQRNGA